MDALGILSQGAMLSHYNLFANARQGEAWMHGAQYRKETFYAICRCSTRSA